jgi:hypothetical protein
MTIRIVKPTRPVKQVATVSGDDAQSITETIKLALFLGANVRIVQENAK